ncbi:TPA: CDP-alcohol phosphatidyltransferase family protein, partial [Pseudomonas aeruginosa]|nr:CDP-alcohol phosphatidyltransferase family protein [Pseudomonas aeruginosa]HEJ2966156.1 CDP-alcohol phosphatidyltransferase family protein [Pseudomonas aeruginosa]HEQ0055009.1 CDP-alcohol phosphatidyltransferase family protein [Pseudomonas aeruginosa]
ASGLLPLAWIDWLMLLIAALLLLTIGNRVRQGLAELAASRRGSDGQA